MIDKSSLNPSHFILVQSTCKQTKKKKNKFIIFADPFQIQRGNHMNQKEKEKEMKNFLMKGWN